MKFIQFILMLIIFFGCQSTQEGGGNPSTTSYTPIYDCHVHLMSPDLIRDWKNLGISFSRPDENYADIDTILLKTNANGIGLIGMGYVYGNPEYFQGQNHHERLEKENDYLFSVAKKFPDKVKPFFTVDPLKNYALEEFKRCININPNSGLKLHFNASQVYLTESDHLNKVRIIFKNVAANNIPILLHFDNSHPKFGKPDVQILFDSILQYIPPLTLTIAHFGTSGGFNQKTKNVVNAFIELGASQRIANKHKIYFDISAVALDKNSEEVRKLSGHEFKELREYIRKIGVENIQFGTDYPLYTSEEYVAILKSKVGLTEKEMGTITQKKDAVNNK